jgi:hypothetical protein
MKRYKKSTFGPERIKRYIKNTMERNKVMEPFTMQVLIGIIVGTVIGYVIENRDEEVEIVFLAA